MLLFSFGMTDFNLYITFSLATGLNTILSFAQGVSFANSLFSCLLNFTEFSPQ